MSLDQDDNIIVGAGTGGSTQGANVATDYNSSTESHYQLFKQAFGKDGDFTAVGDGSDAGSRPLPTKLFQDNGTALSAETLAAGLSVLNVNLRGTSGSGNVPVDINAQTLGVVRVEGKTGGTPMGVCGDNFQIRTLFGATAGNTLTSIFSHGGDFDSIAVQGMSGGHAVGITVDSPLDIRALTSSDQVTVAGTVTVSPGAGFSLDGGTLAIRGGVTGYGHTSLTTSPEGGVPVLLYGNSGGTAAAIGMSGDTLKVSLAQTISADIGDITIDGSAPKASDFDVTGKLKEGSSDGTTVGTPVLLYGMSMGSSTEAVALAVTGGGALLTEIQGSISASVGDISVDVPKAVGYTHGGGIAATGNRNLNLSDGDVTGNTMATPVLLYGASGNTAVGLGITQTVAGAAGEQALLVAGDMRVQNSAGTAIAITLGSAQALDVRVKSLPNVTIGTFTPDVTVNHTDSIAGFGTTLGGIVVNHTDSIAGFGTTLGGIGVNGSVTASGGVTGFGTGGFAGGPPSIANAPGNTNGLPVFLYGNSGGTAGAVGMFGEGIKVHHEEAITVGNVTGNVTVIGGVTGMAETLHDGPGPVGGGGTLALPVLLYGNSGGTAAGFGMSGDGLKVSVIDGVNLTVTGTEVNIDDIQVENKTDTRLAVGLSGDTLVPAGATFHDGTALNVNTHFFGLTGGLHNSFGLTAGGTYGSSIMVTGFSGPGTAVQTEDQSLADHMGGFTNDILRALYTNAASPDDFDPSNPGPSVFDKASSIDAGVESLSLLLVPIAAASTNTSNNTDNFVTDLRSLITGLGEADFNNQTVNDVNQSILRVDVNGIKLPDAAAGAETFGNTAGILPDISVGEQSAVNLPAHLLTKGVNIKNTSGTGIIHIGFAAASVGGAAPVGGYELHSREEVFIETNNLNNLWVSSCPGASGCYIGG